MTNSFSSSARAVWAHPRGATLPGTQFDATVVEAFCNATSSHHTPASEGRKGYGRPLREAIKAAREYGMTDEQIAGELKTTTKKVAALAAHLISSE